MDKDRKITLVSIIMWAACIIVLFCYYSFFDDKKNESKTENRESDNKVEERILKENEYELEAKEIISGMNLSEKIGQMFFARCPENNAIDDIEEYKLGAYILFARDFENKSKNQVKNTIESYQNASKIPMLIGVDEEGGTVTRVSRFDEFRQEKFKSPMELYNSGGLAAIEDDTIEKCKLLSSIGINVNFSPVCDIATDDNAFIYRRTLGQDEEVTADYVGQMVYQMNSLKMGSVLKHFPGYGNNEDTHETSSRDDRSLNELREKDFLPFKQGIEAGARCVLVAHNIVNSIDNDNPASLSKDVHRLLREELNYDNVIITDDLDMDAIGENIDRDDIAIRAVLAGNDMIISSNYKEQISEIKNAVSNGEISEDRINESVVRILSWKLSLGLM